MKMDLTELIENKSFEALTEAEKAFVLQQMSKTEYENQYELLQQYKIFSAEEYERLEVKDEVRKNALQKLRKRKAEKKRGILPMIINYKVPAWAAAAVFLITFSLLSYPFMSSEYEDKGEMLAASKDTVFLEKLIVDTVKIFSNPDTVFRTRYISSTAEEVQASGSAIAATKDEEDKIDADLFNRHKELSNIEVGNQILELELELQPKYSGTSLKDDSIAKILIGIM